MADRPLHIGVDGRELVGHTTGVGRYIGGVLRAWMADPSWRHALTVFAPEPAPDHLAAALGSRVQWSVMPAPRGGTWWEQVQLPRALRRASTDILFAGAYTAPLFSPCPVVVVIHDVSFTAHPEWFGAREGWRRRWLTRQTARRAAAVVTVSQFSAREITRYLGVPGDRITLAPGGAPPERPRAVDNAMPAATNTPTVLYVGSLFNRRLVPELIAAFARVVREVPDARLILVGDNRTRPHVDPREVAARHGISDRVDWRAYVADDELTRLYARASVFAFLSTYEGFGLTPLEAIRQDVPVVLLDTDVTREIYGAGARLVPNDTEAIGRALVDLLMNDAARRAQVAAAAPLLERYTWPKTAAPIRRALEVAAGQVER